MRQDGRALDEKKPASASSTQMEEADPHNSNATAASSASSTQMEDAEPYNPDVTAASSTSITPMEVAEPYNPGVTAASSVSPRYLFLVSLDRNSLEATNIVNRFAFCFLLII